MPRIQHARRMRRLPRATPVALAAAVLSAAGCNTSTDLTGTGTNTTSVAYLRIVQGVSDATNGVDFALNGSVGSLSGLSFGTIFPPSYGQVAPGAQVAFTATGTGAPFFNQAPAALVANARVTLISYGRAAGGATGATAAVLADTSGVTSGTVLLRVFNGVDYVTPGRGTAVDVYVYAQGATRPTAPTVAGLAYGARSAYVPSTVGSLQVDVLTAGAASTTAPLFSSLLATNAGVVRTVVLLDPAVATTTTGATAAGTVLVLTDNLALP